MIVFGSLTTCDPGNIHDTLKQCVEDKIRVSVVALAAEMKICRDFCTETGGMSSFRASASPPFFFSGVFFFSHSGIFGVTMNEGHFRDMLYEHIPPPAVQKPKAAGAQGNENGAAATATGDLMMMGFPTRLPDTSPPTLCACHGNMKSEGYLCPRCLSKVCDIPTDCPVCDLVVVSAPHLARSYHHLFPVKPYEPV